jgi:hypothetical protein
MTGISDSRISPAMADDGCLCLRLFLSSRAGQQTGTGFTVPNPISLHRPTHPSWTVLPVPVPSRNDDVGIDDQTKRTHPRFDFCARAALMTWSIRLDVTLSVPFRRDSSPITRGTSGPGAASRTYQHLPHINLREGITSCDTKGRMGTGSTVPNPNTRHPPECTSWTVMPVPVPTCIMGVRS